MTQRTHPRRFHPHPFAPQIRLIHHPVHMEPTVSDKSRVLLRIQSAFIAERVRGITETYIFTALSPEEVISSAIIGTLRLRSGKHILSKTTNTVLWKEPNGNTVHWVIVLNPFQANPIAAAERRCIILDKTNLSHAPMDMNSMRVTVV